MTLPHQSLVLDTNTDHSIMYSFHKFTYPVLFLEWMFWVMIELSLLYIVYKYLSFSKSAKLSKHFVRDSTVFLWLQHFIAQREDFEETRKSMLVWLTEMDLQLTNVEHFSESDIEHKLKKLKVNTNFYCKYKLQVRFVNTSLSYSIDKGAV